MTKPQAEPQSLLQKLTRYLQLEADAVEVYGLAARQLGALDAIETVGDFRRQHEAQRDELSRLVGAAGGEGFDPFGKRRPTTREYCVLGACLDDGKMLGVLRDGEWARMVEYEAALRVPTAEAEVRNALERGYFACRTRLRWLERRAHESSERRVGALTASPSRRAAR